jgi:hypothetical protein
MISSFIILWISQWWEPLHSSTDEHTKRFRAGTWLHSRMPSICWFMLAFIIHLKFYVWFLNWVVQYAYMDIEMFYIGFHLWCIGFPLTLSRVFSGECRNVYLCVAQVFHLFLALQRLLLLWSGLSCRMIQCRKPSFCGGIKRSVSGFFGW